MTQIIRVKKLYFHNSGIILLHNTKIFHALNFAVSHYLSESILTTKFPDLFSQSVEHIYSMSIIGAVWFKITYV